MTILELTIFVLLALMITISLSFLLAQIAKVVQESSFENDIVILFYHFWNGSPEDELYAWYKVRQVLLQRDNKNKKKKLRFVNRKISEINKQYLYGNMSVSEKGELVDDVVWGNAGK